VAVESDSRWTKVQDDVGVSLWQAGQPQGTALRHNKVSDYHRGSCGWEDNQVSSRLLGKEVSLPHSE
jgi:hypothetical protein